MTGLGARPPPAAMEAQQPGWACGLPLSHGCCPCPPARARTPGGPRGKEATSRAVSCARPAPGCFLLGGLRAQRPSAEMGEEGGGSGCPVTWGPGRGVSLGCGLAESQVPRDPRGPRPGVSLDSVLLVGGLQALGGAEGSSRCVAAVWGSLLPVNPVSSLVPFQPDDIRQVQASSGWAGYPRLHAVMAAGFGSCRSLFLGKRRQTCFVRKT